MSLDEKKEARKNMVIAQIGKSNYQVTNYKPKSSRSDQKNKSSEYCQTGYTFEAVAKQLEHTDVIILAGTEDSYWGSLCYYYSDLKTELSRNSETKNLKGGGSLSLTEAEAIKNRFTELRDYLTIEHKAQKENPVCSGFSIREITQVTIRKKIEDYLTCQLSKFISTGVQVRIVLLEYGRNNQELQNNFLKLQEITESVLDEKNLSNKSINIHFDISNGFRSMPVYIYSFANYLTRIRNQDFSLYMYYGMFEAREKDENGKEFVHLVNLQDVNDLMHWINAVNEFRNYGSVVQVRKILAENPDWDIFVDEENGKKLSTIFLMFDYATNANNLKILEESIDSLMNIKQILECYPERAKSLSHPERLLLENMSEDFQKRFCRKDSNCPYALLTIQLAKWYYEQGRIGNAAIAVQEGTITYVMERFHKEVTRYLDKKEKYGYTSEPDNLFNYGYRDLVKKLIERSKGLIEKDSRTFFSNYLTIKDNIRNVNAHILYTDADLETIETYGDQVNKQIDTILAELHKSKTDKLLFANLFVPKSPALRNLIVNIKNNINGPISLQDIDDPVLRAGIDNFLNQLRVMKHYYDQNDFEGFYRQRDNLPLIFQILEKWMDSTNATRDINTYKKYFYRSAKKSIPGYMRLLGYLETHENDFIEIIRSATNEVGKI